MRSIALAFLFAPLLAAQTVAVNSGTTYQTIDGWGASTGFAESNPNLNSAQADCFFLSSSSGSCAFASASIGLSWIRIQDNNTANSAPDLATLQLAVARGAKVLLGFNPSVALSSGNYASLAAYQVAKVQYFISQGITPSAITPVNEPQYMGSGSTTAAQIDTFIASYLWPALNSAGLGSIPLTVSDHSGWFSTNNPLSTNYVDACLTDTNCASHVTTVSAHGYWTAQGSQGNDGFSGGVGCCVDYSAVHPPTTAAGKKIWMTEVNGGTSACTGTTNLAAYSNSMADALVYAHNIHDFLTGSNGGWTPYGSAWMYWNLQSDGENSGSPGSCNDGLTDDAFNPAQRYYAIGNFSKFVRPGQVRIAATPTPQTNVYVTAFLNQSTGAFEIVAINTNSGSVSQTFALSGLSASAMTPWITSGSLNLAQQANVAVSSGSFTYTIPGSSVTTFVSNSSGTTCAATSCSPSDVTAALACVTSATTLVTIPAGTCAWTSGVTFTVPSGNTNLTIQGQTAVGCSGTPGASSYSCTATDNTVIEDNWNNGNGGPLLNISTAAASSFFRITGITFQGGTSTQSKFGLVSVGSSSQNVRLDHIHWNHLPYPSGVNTGWVRLYGNTEGVADHSVFDLSTCNGASGGCIGQTSIGIAVYNPIGDSVGNGDGTFNNPTAWGTSAFFFVEDNVFNGGVVDDCADAGKIVLRYNTINNNYIGYQNHGTKSQAGAARGCRAYEVYNNYFEGPATTQEYAAGGAKGTTALIYNNNLASGWYYLFAASTDRNTTAVTETNTPNGWGWCGTTVDSNGVGSCWDGNQGGTSSGCHSLPAPSSQGYPCLDGLGRGQTNQSLNGLAFPNRLNSTTGTINWPQQNLEPIYMWGNTIYGGASGYAQLTDSVTQNNRDVFYDAGSLNTISPTCTGAFNGTCGTGTGVAASRPSTCTAGPGGTYGFSPTGSYGVGYYATDTDTLSICTATNTWGVSFNPTYTYPHPLDGGTSLFTLTITTVGTGSGSVSGPNCSSGNYASGTSVGACNATPSAGSTFTGWSTSGSASCTGTSACGPFTLSASTNLQATFTLSSTLNLTISIVGTGSGTVTGTNCTTGVYSSGTSIGACTAVPGAGSTFSGWLTTGSASCTGTSACGPFTISANTNLQATFTATTACGNPTQNPPNYSGTYSSPPTVLPLSVSWTSPTAGCNMFMTLDTSAPTCSGTPYAAQSFTTTTTMRVIACQTGFTSSVIEGGTWTILTTAASPTNLNGVLVQGTGVKIQ